MKGQHWENHVVYVRMKKRQQKNVWPIVTAGLTLFARKIHCVSEDGRWVRGVAKICR